LVNFHENMYSSPFSPMAGILVLSEPPRCPLVSGQCPDQTLWHHLQ